MTIRPVKAGDPLSMRAQNRLIDQVNRNSRPGSPAVAQWGTGGPVFLDPTIATFSWWELTAALTYPEDKTDTPYTDNAKQVFYNPYTGHDEAHTVGKNRLYAPGAPRLLATGNYIGRPTYVSGMRVPAVLNLQSGHWEIIDPNPKCWAKAQGDWQENGSYPSGDPKVSVKVCDRNGANEAGTAFDVFLPRNPRNPTGKEHDADPAVYEDWVIGWELDSEGTPICTTPYLHKGKIKDIHMQGADDIVPTGWHECDGSNQTGNAGAFDLADFARDYAPCGGDPTHVVGAFPRHKSTDEAVLSADRWSYYFDGIGHGVNEGVDVVHVPNEGIFRVSPEAPDAHEHWADVGVGEYPAEIVMFIQRYK